MNQLALIVVDMQTSILKCVERRDELVSSCQTVIQAMRLLDMPVIFTEQAPEKLGRIDPHISKYMVKGDPVLPKTTFSCMLEPEFKKTIIDLNIKSAILIGLEAHVCIYQTAEDLLGSKINVTVLNDAISSHSLYDYSTSIALMRDKGVEISSAETVIYSLVKGADHPKFQEIQTLIKNRRGKSHCCCF